MCVAVTVRHIITVLKSVARIQLVVTEDPSACVTVNYKVLYLLVFMS
jgi:hypothetical protein